ncbi:hypothetical protein Ancab_038116, partial [Ancistrocladus abbreviatus]
LAAKKQATVATMGTWGVDSWRWQIQWVRPLCEAEEGLERQLLVLLAANHPNKASPNSWR